MAFSRMAKIHFKITKGVVSGETKESRSNSITMTFKNIENVFSKFSIISFRKPHKSKIVLVLIQLKIIRNSFNNNQIIVIILFLSKTFITFAL